MHFPSRMSGEDDVKNVGKVLVSLRPTPFPVAASRQETVPRTPRVQTLPSATAGVLRGPRCGPPAGLSGGAVAAYFSCQAILPLAASRQVMTSSPPWRVKV